MGSLHREASCRALLRVVTRPVGTSRGEGRGAPGDQPCYRQSPGSPHPALDTRSRGARRPALLQSVSREPSSCSGHSLPGTGSHFSFRVDPRPFFREVPPDESPATTGPHSTLLDFPSLLKLGSISFFTKLSDQITRSVMSDSLRPHESQLARPPCPSPTPGVHSDSRPSSQ